MSILDDAIRDLRLHRLNLVTVIDRLRSEADEFEVELGRVDGALLALGADITTTNEVPAPVAKYVEAVETKVAEAEPITTPKRPIVNGKIGTPAGRHAVTECQYGCGYSKDWRPAVLRHETGCDLRPGVAAPEVVVEPKVEAPGPADVVHALSLPTAPPKSQAMTRAEFTDALREGRRLPDGKVLACTERHCGHEVGSTRDLIVHTNGAHGRQPFDEEKFPVLPATRPR